MHARSAHHQASPPPHSGVPSALLVLPAIEPGQLRNMPLFSAVLRRPKLIISERSPFSNSGVFAKANLHGPELGAYLYTLNELMQALPPVQVTSVYLVTSVETALARTRQRDRDSESEISPEYMQLLLDLHERLDNSLPAGSAFVRVPAEGEKEKTARALVEVVDRILGRVDAR